jgi:rsbT co-antagonist protein RsbR
VLVAKSRLPEVIALNEKELLADWLHLQKEVLSGRRDRLSDSEMAESSRLFLRTLTEALSRGAELDLSAPEWARMRELLGDISRQCAAQGLSPSETATFVFSFKKPFFARIANDCRDDKQRFEQEVWAATELLDELGLYTIETFQKTREEIIARQQQEMLELSTPVVELWHGILALPLIGTLDSARTQIVMQNLLEAIVAKSADLAIMDITGVPTVDTLVAQHLLKTVAAARLMGAECIISGIRPQIAQTIIHLGVDLSGVLTKSTLADAFQLALRRKSLAINRV